MALAELINLSPDIKKVGLSEERVRACLPEIRKFVSFGGLIQIYLLISFRLVEMIICLRS